MNSTHVDMIGTTDRSQWVRLRTMVALRWVAICGQIVSVEFARLGFGLKMPLGPIYLVIGIAIVAILIAQFAYPENKRLSEGEAFAMLLFDLLQLSALLFLTGGLNNPFSVLFLAPVTIAATLLPLRPVLLLAGAAAILSSLMFVWHLPLVDAKGVVLRLPGLLLMGNWAALLVGIGFLATYAWRVSSEVKSMSEALQATQMALAREQKLTDLGGVVAAAAHELGTPLATIKLVSTELIDELEEREDLAEDAALIREQADRCRDILRSMGRAGKDDLHLRQAPLDSVLREAAEPHVDRGKEIEFVVTPERDGDNLQPSIYRRPDVIHGLRNLIQNAVDFSHQTIWVEAHWNDDLITIRISDDGEGFASGLAGRIGDPFVKSRRTISENPKRPGYEGMGLGLFIAKTLLERSGARLSFANGVVTLPGGEPNRKCGAIVEVVWRRADISAAPSDERRPLGSNTPISVSEGYI